MDHEVPLQDTAGRGSRTSARLDTTNLRSAGSGDRTRSSVAGTRAYAGIGTASSGAVEACAVHQGPIVAPVARRVDALAKAVLGKALVGAVDEAIIKEYIETQKWDLDDQGFKITSKGDE